jgi:tetratricopeptide (TPR) repeat protein
MLKELKQQSNKSIYPGYTRNGQLGEYITRGDVYLGQSKYNLAISTYKKALKLNPKNVYALKGLERIHVSQSKANQ